jgi:hypothetical protein
MKIFIDILMSTETCSICLENFTNRMQNLYLNVSIHIIYMYSKWTKDTCPICGTTWTITEKYFRIPRQIEHNYDNDNVILQ